MHADGFRIYGVDSVSTDGTARAEGVGSLAGHRRLVYMRPITVKLITGSGDMLAGRGSSV